MLPLFYQTHLQQHLTRAQFLVLGILLNLLQSERQLKLERLASAFPYPITAPLSAPEITEVLEFASTNNQSDLVSLHHLLVNYLLSSGSDFINCDRTWRGLYQYTLGLPGVEKRAIPLFWSLSCRAFKLHIRGGRDAHPTRVLLFFEIQFKCRNSLLPKPGSSNLTEQRNATAEILPLLKDYKVVVIGDR